MHKAHGQDDIFIRMINISDKSLLKPLFFFKIELSYLITQIDGKGPILYLCIKIIINN